MRTDFKKSAAKLLEHYFHAEMIVLNPTLLYMT